MTTEAGSPCLNRHVPRSEERATMDRALTRIADILDRYRRLDHGRLELEYRGVLLAVQFDLAGGDPRSGRDETQAQPAKPPLNLGGDTQKETV